MNLQEAVHNFLQKYALCGHEVLCGFSGGADSTSLLLALSREQLGSLTAVHFHHGIRGAEADADAEWCRVFCEKRGIHLELIYLNVPENMLPGEATEEAARRLRLENAALRASNAALRRLELDALRRELDARLYGRRVLGPLAERLWALLGTACIIYDKIKRRLAK